MYLEMYESYSVDLEHGNVIIRANDVELNKTYDPLQAPEILMDFFNYINDVKLYLVMDNIDSQSLLLFAERSLLFINKYGLLINYTPSDEFMYVSVLHYKLKDIYNVMSLWNEYQFHYYSFDDLYYDNNNTWGKWLKFNTNKLIASSDYRQIFDIVNDKVVIGWKYKSLLQAITIMYIDNLKDKNVKICPAKSCHKPFISTTSNNYCCSYRCNSAIRAERIRHRAKIKSFILKGLTIQEIAVKMKVGSKYISDLIDKN